ncbi:MAG: aminoacyl-tRNA hydrolase [Elusimicrobia bacterium]|nr:aminoacyl-tRNA hydrolase [Elusimicrobiota bacterium]
MPNLARSPQPRQLKPPPHPRNNLFQIRFIIGLGNPGSSYKGTPHNLGRETVGFLAERKGLRWKKNDGYEWTDSQPSYVRLKTYMNLSGEAVSQLLREKSVSPPEILICSDDFDLNLGTIRIRKQGSAGSHKGLQSIIRRIQTEQFPRLRIGVGPLPKDQDPAEFVLKPFSKGDWEMVRQAIETASSAIEMILTTGLDKAMNHFNRPI